MVSASPGLPGLPNVHGHVCRFRLVSYVALTVIAFGTLGRAARLVTLRAQDLPAAVSNATQAGE
jgi:hypothetical protein